MQNANARAAKLLTVPQVARLVGVAPGTVRKWVNRGILKAFRFPERTRWKQVRIGRTELMKFLESIDYPMELLRCDKTPRITGKNPLTDKPCQWCKEVKRTSVEEIWSEANPEGFLRRLCRECCKGCTGG